jgi:hypothetical protein
MDAVTGAVVIAGLTTVGKPTVEAIGNIIGQSERCADCPQQHMLSRTVASIISASNAPTKNLGSATRAPAASTTVL